MIPSRVATDFTCGFNLLEVKENFVPSNFESPRGSRNTSVASEHGTPSQLYDQMLQSELLGKPTPPRRDDDTLKLATPESNQKLFQYKSVLEEVPRWFDECESTKSPVPYLSSPEHSGYQKPPCRKIQKTPARVMDAPDMQDDFYCNLIDWSSTDDLAVGLGSSVYCWNAGNNRVAKLCDLGSSAVTSVNWTQQGKHLAVGSESGEVQIWDKEKCRKLRTMTGHEGKVCSIAWNGYVLSTGGQDGHIIHRDVRQAAHSFADVHAHRLQVCGLKWSPDCTQLASGSDDCKVRIWNLRSHAPAPVLECSHHKAAVKALAWSPHQAGMLASGGGVADKCIHLWNTTNDVTVKSVDTGSQVCNLIWSNNVNEIVSTHGYSQFEVAIWKASSMTRFATLPGHSQRVLYLTISPDGRKIATGSGDHSVRIWDVFPAAKACMKSTRVSLLPSTIR